jgi:phosphohistidine swiveling domain-containing protein
VNFQMTRSKLQTLADLLDADRVGAKAANLSRLHTWGYAVPSGWIWRSGDDRDSLFRCVQPSRDCPVIVRSSAIGEDSLQASAAGQYDSIAHVIDRATLDQALDRCLASYASASAIAYRRDRGSDTVAMSLLVQRQVSGVVSGVAFSRDPVAPNGDQVAIEVVTGGASALVSGRVTPARYSVTVPDTIPEAIPPLAIAVDGTGDRRSKTSQAAWIGELVIEEALNQAKTDTDSKKHLKTDPFPEIAPDRLREILQSIAAIARQLERRNHGTPQDLEWTYDGQTLWLLQARPISTLYPIWTRRIAAEVAPGAVHPLAWSISQPLTCGVWGSIFTTVLGDRAAGLDFSQTATLHGSHAYFNASLLGDIFRRMGLPPESLEFLVRDQPMSRPSFRTLLINLPGLLRLVGQQLRLTKTFARNDRALFTPLLQQLTTDPINLQTPQHSPSELFDRLDRILAALQPATRYNILAPIGLAIRQKIAKIDDLDSGMMPEVQATRAFQTLASELRHYLDRHDPGWATREPVADLRSWLNDPNHTPDQDPDQDPDQTPGRILLDQFDAWLDRYGYLSDVGTNIAIPTWRETPDRWLRLWWQAAKALTTAPKPPLAMKQPQDKQTKNQGSRSLQEFARLKGRVAEVYDRLLAELRWCFVALEHQEKLSQTLPASTIAEAINTEINADINTNTEINADINTNINTNINTEIDTDISTSNQALSKAGIDPAGDIFWLTIAEIRQIFAADAVKPTATPPAKFSPLTDLPRLIQYRRAQFDRDRQRTTLPRLVYGASLPDLPPQTTTASAPGEILTGIGASRGQVRGRIVLVSQFDPSLDIDRDTILVVPYTDAGWSPLLVQAGGLISAVGGRLSHGAIVAREYGIPAVMDVAEAFERLQSGQWVQIDGERGTIEPIAPSS